MAAGARPDEHAAPTLFPRRQLALRLRHSAGLGGGGAGDRLIAVGAGRARAGALVRFLHFHRDQLRPAVPAAGPRDTAQPRRPPGHAGAAAQLCAAGLGRDSGFAGGGALGRTGREQLLLRLHLFGRFVRGKRAGRRGKTTRQRWFLPAGLYRLQPAGDLHGLASGPPGRAHGLAVVRPGAGRRHGLGCPVDWTERGGKRRFPRLGSGRPARLSH